ncbi:MAG: periplasmic protein TonB [Alphaproteobacteria bacterium]|nr:periplasmic protein TonB [Alphaproteobacteria bacterium]
MTVPFPLNAFDGGLPVSRLRPRPSFDRGKLVSIGLTIAFHAVILGAALTAVEVARPHAMRELSVSISPDHKPLPKEDLAPPPKLAQPPSVITMAPPDVAFQTASPIAAAPAAPKPVAAAPISQPSPVAGEGKDAFLGRLLGQLNRFKQYPRAARQAHIEGVVMLHFIMDADGKVTSFEIAKSSGRPILDAEALALIQRAQPLPAIPASYPSRTLDAIVPIEFYLDR